VRLSVPVAAVAPTLVEWLLTVSHAQGWLRVAPVGAALIGTAPALGTAEIGMAITGTGMATLITFTIM